MQSKWRNYLYVTPFRGYRELPLGEMTKKTLDNFIPEQLAARDRVFRVGIRVASIVIKHTLLPHTRTGQRSIHMSVVTLGRINNWLPSRTDDRMTDRSKESEHRNWSQCRNNPSKRGWGTSLPHLIRRQGGDWGMNRRMRLDRGSSGQYQYNNYPIRVWE